MDEATRVELFRGSDLLPRRHGSAADLHGENAARHAIAIIKIHLAHEALLLKAHGLLVISIIILIVTARLTVRGNCRADETDSCDGADAGGYAPTNISVPPAVHDDSPAAARTNTGTSAHGSTTKLNLNQV